MTVYDRYLRFRDEIAKVLDPRTHTIGWLDAQVWSGQAMVWAEDDAIILAEIKSYPTGANELHGLVAAGNAETIIDTLIPAAEQWARGHNFLFTSIASRPGWERLLKGAGYEMHQIYIRKELR